MTRQQIATAVDQALAATAQHRATLNYENELDALQHWYADWYSRMMHDSADHKDWRYLFLVGIEGTQSMSKDQIVEELWAGDDETDTTEVLADLLDYFTPRR